MPLLCDHWGRASPLVMGYGGHRLPAPGAPSSAGQGQVGRAGRSWGLRAVLSSPHVLQTGRPSETLGEVGVGEERGLGWKRGFCILRRSDPGPWRQPKASSQAKAEPAGHSPGTRGCQLCGPLHPLPRPSLELRAISNIRVFFFWPKQNTGAGQPSKVRWGTGLSGLGLIPWTICSLS